MASFISAIERFASSYDERVTQEWIHRHWPKTIAISVLYIILVFSGRRWMEKREKYNLRWALTLWSASLALFSIISTWFILGRAIHDLRMYGFRHTICDNTFFYTGSGIWMYWFSCSKVVELGDTFFIVVRKQKLMFLHWYHHVATLIFTWYGHGNEIALGMYFSGINVAIHSVMYSYYAIRASGLVRMPRQVNVTITSLQLLQMVFGVYINIYAYIELLNSRPCNNNLSSIYFSFVMYFSYVVLFANFFCQNYMAKQNHSGKVYTNGVNLTGTKKES
ncbi:putative elongation of very long chain fatty acids protein 6-like [Apostichopus japonicus]|uniref:Elongation of very long chain fatty acids protein n=1 Tax=Stichopus japonicus TaxID=307972 RepID=A0A2G8LBF5_STIJA|nr:putative elongation of very long chain fatty acids protein 6-like [Apostichopus japonicus]